MRKFAKITDDLTFNSNKDFVILPEIFAHLAEDLLIKNKIKYAIFVQNGYSINFTNNSKKLSNAYEKAEFLLSYSTDITECIKLNFPKLKTKILKIKYSIENPLFKSSIKKENLITYMSRKHPSHSSLMINFLNKNSTKGGKF